jgi:hypothetical protein
LLFCIALTILGCRHNKNPEELHVMFYKNEKDLNAILKRIQTDEKLDSLFQYPGSGLPNIADSYPDIYLGLKRLGIKHASSHNNYFNKYTNWYYFETTWPNEYLICLVYNAYDSVKNRKGYYSKDEIANETWGLGNSWSMFRLVKVKEHAQ